MPTLIVYANGISKKVTYWYENNSLYVIYMHNHKKINYTNLFVDEKLSSIILYLIIKDT